VYRFVLVGHFAWRCAIALRNAAERGGAVEERREEEM
jgi:hypothetical protein